MLQATLLPKEKARKFTSTTADAQGLLTCQASTYVVSASHKLTPEGEVVVRLGLQEPGHLFRSPGPSWLQETHLLLEAQLSLALPPALTKCPKGGQRPASLPSSAHQRPKHNLDAPLSTKNTED